MRKILIITGLVFTYSFSTAQEQPKVADPTRAIEHPDSTLQIQKPQDPKGRYDTLRTYPSDRTSRTKRKVRGREQMVQPDTTGQMNNMPNKTNKQ